MAIKGLKTRHLVGVCILTSFACLTFWTTRNLPRRLETRLGLIQQSGTKLASGMSKREVETIVGKPDNQDTEHVWMWLTTNSLETGVVSWIENYTEPGYFLVFRNNKLISPLLKNMESDPWEVLKYLPGNRVDPESILGKKPIIIRAE